MKRVYIVQGVHWYVPNEQMFVYSDLAKAKEEAASLVNILRADVELDKSATPENYEAKLQEARKKRADDLGCEVDELNSGGELDDGDVWIMEFAVDSGKGGELVLPKKKKKVAK